MKFAVVAIALAGLAGAQDTQLPSCAQDCVNRYTTTSAIAGCSQLDIKCICSNSAFLDGIACCLAGVCPQSDQDTAVRFAKNICTGAGVAVPDQVVCKNATSTGGTQSGGATQTATPTAANTAAATSTPNAAPTMGPVALLGGLIVALAVL
ncbi:GPI-anchored CFEM domain protein [Colletotrichum sidae]|uniref:GPI-anchored CFEM domain protein n=3 Tax=Colletotrichum orbiculare species complex TaxID=2707354 RepID=N4UP50_COLOR|nr:GPI-anchored CFEM domain protein [Colletotrichum orbiculare MAFF 240422]TDZ65924.1 GPI-anchored CFEM domain protein [Colletotrichum trifolii]TEA18862.1 GPI-anchored CFEM domain protein [Colletotrichum sidae]